MFILYVISACCLVIATGMLVSGLSGKGEAGVCLLLISASLAIFPWGDFGNRLQKQDAQQEYIKNHKPRIINQFGNCKVWEYTLPNSQKLHYNTECTYKGEA